MTGQIGIIRQVVPPLEGQFSGWCSGQRTRLALTSAVRVLVVRTELARAIDRLHAGVAGWTLGGFGGRG